MNYASPYKVAVCNLASIALNTFVVHSVAETPVQNHAALNYFTQEIAHKMNKLHEQYG